MPLSAYINSLLFAGDAQTCWQRRPAAEADEQLLAELPACLGACRLSNNLNQLAKAANTGSLYFDADTKDDIKRACDDMRAMRLMLMQALGLQVKEEPREKESISQAFTRAASAKPTFRKKGPRP